MTGLKV